MDISQFVSIQVPKMRAGLGPIVFLCYSGNLTLTVME